LLIEKYAACPVCFSGLTANDGRIRCTSCGKGFALADGAIISTLGASADEIEFSKQKWDQYYSDEGLQDTYDTLYRESILPLVLKQLHEYVPEHADTRRTFLEIGCGRATLGEEMVKRGWFFIGIDYSLNVLEAVRRRFEKEGIGDYLLIHGDITVLPVKTGTVDLIYGGGVIEHFKDTQTVVNHLFRILRPQGVSFNSVPFVNIGNILYRSRWGSIPNVPVLRQIAEFIHIRLLKGKHMRFGFELQFTAEQLKKIHREAGFIPENIIVDRFDYYVALEYVKNKYLRAFFTRLIKTNRQFWQMVKVIGIKE